MKLAKVIVAALLGLALTACSSIQPWVKAPST